LATGTPFDDATIAEVIGKVRDGGFIDATLAGAGVRLKSADDALRALPPGKPKEILEMLGRFLLNRVEAARS
jgi:hypothetical protein